MRVTLVQPPSQYYDWTELAPPLGLLSIATVLQDDSIDVSILDFNLRGLRDRDYVDHGFLDSTLGEIWATAPDVVGFTSMALESHVCLEIARRLKQQNSTVRIVLGGPHFSSIAVECLHRFRWIDYVVMGGGELPFRQLLRHLREPPRARELVNVAHRRGATVQAVRAFKPVSNLDDVPASDYGTVDLAQ